MIIKFKRLYNNVPLPTIAYKGDAGFDLVTINWTIMGDVIEYQTGIAVEIPEGYVGLIFPRSSVYRKDLILSNSVGVIDSGYRGEIKFKFRTTTEVPSVYAKGDKVGQLIIVPIPNIELIEVDQLTPSDRGDKGFGSSGN